MTLLVLDAVHRTFRVGTVSVPAIRDVSLVIDAGECVAVMGASGSGKSTLMNMVGLLDRPTSGTIQIDGEDTARLSDDARARLRGGRIGFVFQSYNLLPRSTAVENVELPLIYAGVQPRLRRLRARAALESVGMSMRETHFPSQLSGGEQQRVAIARALVGDPAILLADEPTGALDSRTGSEILALFRKLNRDGQTIVMITHDAAVAAHCARVVQLRDGRIVADMRQAAWRADAA
ncbi:ABC transporter ATP-binding protein [Methylobacterium sp. NEAU K]|uniref:ABC transporter ATP-binding protein n=1 Tax=Methylobacterium sp. NEAU K TaxID=3064946 RepID=UPI002736EFB8|nr:ABC transporter ATP-binding protein [Methylobacterium sp. NEAU K]MDP4002677.1 ABC transporter ATP-binding protein [Methylobacterium sp. NEAU K]